MLTLRCVAIDLGSTTRATVDTSLALGPADAPGLVTIETKSTGGPLREHHGPRELACG